MEQKRLNLQNYLNFSIELVLSYSRAIGGDPGVMNDIHDKFLLFPRGGGDPVYAGTEGTEIVLFPHDRG